MLSRRYFFYVLFFHLTNSQLHINLHFTNSVSNNKDLQHDCLYAAAKLDVLPVARHIIPYCMGESPSKWNITENNFGQKFTFAELLILNITSRQLYMWSAPMDIVEDYQFYLNQIADSKKTLTVTEYFYNCTLPNFGPKCQYVLYDQKPHHSSLYDIIHDYYDNHRYTPTTLTCYTHLKCDRGLPPSCLDWSEICDGTVDCLNGGDDEKHCWQLEIHECDENEFRCRDGQCIPIEFYEEIDVTFDCLDRSDEYYMPKDEPDYVVVEPSFGHEDITCVLFNHASQSALSSSCYVNRHDILLQAMYSIKPETISDECWTAFKCTIGLPIASSELCDDFCSDEACIELMKQHCPDIIYAPTVPVFLGHVFLVYDKNKLNYEPGEAPEPTYICYNNERLHVPDDHTTIRLPNNTNTCRLYKDSISNAEIYASHWIDKYLHRLRKWLASSTSWIYSDSILCNKSTMYQCINSSKCISKNRFDDQSQDCFYDDDENMNMWDKNCSLKRNRNYFKCETTNECIPRHFVKDSICHCLIHHSEYCDDEHQGTISMRTEIKFYEICNGAVHLFPQIIDGEIHTDETECDQWPCNNIYTYNDGIWHCLNGTDEINSKSKSLLNCSANNHICVSYETNELMCLSMEKVNDGVIDCLGAADEPTRCILKEFDEYEKRFYCKDDSRQSCISSRAVCDRYPDCANKEDEKACQSVDLAQSRKFYGICAYSYDIFGSDITKVLCPPFTKSLVTKKFKLAEIQDSSVTLETTRILPRQFVDKNPVEYQPRCHRGINLQVWLDKEKNLTTSTCLCPPSYYGDICQFQNQRVSLTIQFRVTSDSVQLPLVIIISLIDNSDERIIHSYEQFSYLAKKHCQEKFHVYLLYLARPKNETKQYSIHIDIYEKKSLDYRGSVIKPILFPFLPVYRLSFQMSIPRKIEYCSNRSCIKGKCVKYFNDTNKMTFCQCNEGWSGRDCTIQHKCNCSSDSLCIGKLSNDRSLCVCPVNKMGNRCLLDNTVCQNQPCLNKGECVAIDEYRTIDKQFYCICQKGFFGDTCEKNETKIIVSFDKDIVLSSSMFIHLFSPDEESEFFRTTAIKTIPFGQNSVTIYLSSAFHMIFIDLFVKEKDYYLLYIQNEYQEGAIIEKRLYSSDRCLHIQELLNETVANYNRLRRIKHYHAICQINSSPRLMCFYDEVQLCLCQDHYQQSLANCLDFDHNMKMNCADKSGCENDGECYQDDLKCPKATLCRCSKCFYGTQCQLSTNEFSLSLDTILGYHIQPNINLRNQPGAVLGSFILSIFIIIIGLINGTLSLITFKNKTTWQTGCGIYLLCSSLIILLTMVIFALKISILIFSQMGLIINQTFLHIQCRSIDFLLRFCLTIDQWLTACVAIERAFISIKGLNFNKNQTKIIAKWIIISLILIIAGSTVQDPIYRSLFEEENDEEKRIWCIVDYPPTVRIINSIISSFHFIVPFIINVISTIVIITVNTRQRLAVQTQQTYKQVLKEQVQQHKNLLIGPCVLIIVGIPRLIISFAAGCMKSASDSWLFLVGYFISLIPSLVTFILFVLPSTTYKQAFRKAVSQYRNMFNRRE